MIPKRSTWRYSALLWMECNKRNFDINKAVAFTNKSVKNIYRMKARMGNLTIPNWTKEEELLLLEKGPEEASKLINKTIGACRTKRTRLLKKL